MDNAMRGRRWWAACCVACACGLAAGCSGDGGDGRAGGEEVDLSAPPTGVRWEQTSGVWLPVSDEDGPRESHPVSGYAHTPQGAGMAAVNGPLRAAVADDKTWGQVAAAVFAPGPGRDVFAVNRAQISVSGGDVDASAAPTVRGWVISDYSPEAATVSVVTSYPDDSLAKATYRLVWDDDDWKVVLAEDGAGDVVALDEAPAEMVEVAR